MALTKEEITQLISLRQGGWNSDELVLFMVMAQIGKLPIPAICILWENASADYFELFPMEEPPGDEEVLHDKHESPQ